MKWELFLDDVRFPVNLEAHIARSSYDALWMIEHRGMPYHIDFDHDLTGQDTAMNLLSWMEATLIDGVISFPAGFTYAVHSQNPVGAQNIKHKMEHLLIHFGEEDDTV